jgi:hypothetical protein
MSYLLRSQKEEREEKMRGRRRVREENEKMDEFEDTPSYLQNQSDQWQPLHQWQYPLLLQLQKY